MVDVESMHIGRAIKLNNGDFRKRLSDYRRESDSSRKHKTGKKINEIKRDERLKTSGELIGFNYNDVTWELEPKTLFYDWIYINSLNRNKNLSIQILDYDAFTDIEFNQEKSINCQARSAAIFVSLKKNGKLEEVLNDKKEFIKIYSSLKYEEKQLSLFD